jgi:hypothetical protein
LNPQTKQWLEDLSELEDGAINKLAGNILKYADSLSVWDIDERRKVHGERDLVEDQETYGDKTLKKRKKLKETRRENADTRNTHETARFLLLWYLIEEYNKELPAYSAKKEEEETDL